MFKKIIKKCFFYESYAVAYRFLNTVELAPNAEVAPYTVIIPRGLYWCADPFPFEYQNRHYIFVEYYNLWKTKADLACYCLEEGGKLKIILKENFHLSYPNIFAFEDQIYMIPETHSVKQLRLYKAKVFPDQWEMDTVLLNNIDLADASFFFAEDEQYIYIEAMEDRNGSYSNRFFRLDMQNKEVREIQQSTLSFVDKRPAGNFFYTKEGIYHALQECSQLYGEYMHICKVDSFNKGELKEHIEKRFTADMYTFENTKNIYSRTHTLNRSRNLEVIDVLNIRFSLLLVCAKIWVKIQNIFK